MRHFLEMNEAGEGIEVTTLDKDHHLANKRRRSFRAGGWIGFDLKTYAKPRACYSCGNENTGAKLVEDDADDGITDVFLVCSIAHCDGNTFPEWLEMIDDY